MKVSAEEKSALQDEHIRARIVEAILHSDFPSSNTKRDRIL